MWICSACEKENIDSVQRCQCGFDSSKDIVKFSTFTKLSFEELRAFESKISSQKAESKEEAQLRKIISDIIKNINQSNSTGSLFKEKKNLSQNVIEQIVKNLVGFQVVENDILAVHLPENEFDTDGLIITTNAVYVYKNDGIEYYFMKLPLELLLKVSKTLYKAKLFGYVSKIQITFIDGRDIEVDNKMYLQALYWFLSKFIEQSPFLKQTNTKREQDLMEQDNIDEERKKQILLTAIDRTNMKSGNYTFLYTRNKDTMYLSYIYLPSAKGEQRTVYISADAIYGKMLRKPISLNNINRIRLANSYWISIIYEDGNERMVSFGKENTNIMYEFLNQYMICQKEMQE